MNYQPVLIDGAWRQADATAAFQACNPATRKWLPDEYPVSSWADCDAALTAAARAAAELRQIAPDQIALFLDAFADRITKQQAELIELAHLETGLPKTPRLANAELPRTINQLRQAAEAARDRSWRMATLDTQNNLRSYFAPLGPVCVFGPNNFPFAFGSLSGGDFAAAIAAGNPVIGKANSSHPGTTRLFAVYAREALEQTGLPPSTVQLLYRISHADGENLVADYRVGATGYTGSRLAGLKLKAAADAAGKPIYVELSSVNPVVLLPGAIRQRSAAIAQELTDSALMGTGQFCTNPGMILLLQSAESEALIRTLTEKYQQAPVGVLLSGSVQSSLAEGIQILEHAGATRLTGGPLSEPQASFCCGNTLMRVSAKTYMEHPHVLQTEAFGNCTLLVVSDTLAELATILPTLEGNLTGCFYSATDGTDDAAYDQLEPLLRPLVGRLLNDKMPTGVAVSPAMNHGGPFPATGHPGFTAVGLPTSLVRFAMLQCYDGVRPARLPAELRDEPPHERMWRRIDGQWRQGPVVSPTR